MLPISPSLDTVGAMARSAVDVASLARVIAGYDLRDPYAVAPPATPEQTALAVSAQVPSGSGGPLDGLRVGVARGFFFDGVGDVMATNARAAADTLVGLGAWASEIDMSDAGRARDDCAELIRAEALALHERRSSAMATRSAPTSASGSSSAASRPASRWPARLTGCGTGRRACARRFSRST